MIKVVLFDYGGVISDPATWQKLIEEAYTEEATRLTEEVLPLWRTARVGEQPEEFLTKMASILDIEKDEFKEKLAGLSLPEPEMIELARELTKEYKVGILSNQIDSWLGVLIENHKLDEVFDPIITSYEAGLAKPDKRIYEYAKDLLECEYEEILFIDDRRENTAAAQALGMEIVTCEDQSKLKKQLYNKLYN